MQKSLKLLKNFKDNKGNTAQVEGDEVTMALLNDLWNELDTKYFTVDRIAAAASGLMNSSGFGSGLNIGKNGANTAAQKATVSNINQQIQNLLDATLSGITNSINQVLNKDTTNAEEISKVVAQTQMNIDNFMNNLNSNFKVLDTSTQKQTLLQLESMFGELKNAIQSDSLLNQSVQIEKIINDLATGLSGGLAANQYKGDIFESLIAVTGQRLAGVAMKNFDTTIKNGLVTGQSRSARGIVRANFSSEVDWEKALSAKSFKQPFGDKFIVSADAVQDKVDVVIELNDGNNAYISAKNYNLKSLQKGVKNTSASFLTLIQNENQNNIVNHYLNLNAVTGKGRHSLNAAAAEVNNLMRKIAIAKLITGYNTVTGVGQTMQAANVFAVLNSDTYEVKLYNMKDVLEGIFSQKRYEKMYIPSYFYKTNIKAPIFQTRLNNIIKQLNVSVSYTLREEEYAH